MSLTVAVWNTILLALIGANLPFVNQRLLLVIRLKRFTKKPLWIRLVEMVFYYLLVGMAAYGFEWTLGNVFTQGWEFYTITACLFLVFAFPGFAFQTMHKHRMV
jgi:hypothetical protein